MAGRVTSSQLTKFFTYSRTARSQSEYAANMKRLSSQIFGEVRRPMNVAQQKLVARFAEEPKEQAERWVSYYPAVEETNELVNQLRNYGLYRDEHKDFCEEMQRLRSLRGKTRVRTGWKDGQKPEKVVRPRYDGLNSYKPDPSHI